MYHISNAQKYNKIQKYKKIVNVRKNLTSRIICHDINIEYKCWVMVELWEGDFCNHDTCIANNRYYAFFSDNRNTTKIQCILFTV